MQECVHRNQFQDDPKEVFFTFNWPKKNEYILVLVEIWHFISFEIVFLFF